MNNSSHLTMTSEEQSFLNIVNFFSPELKRIMAGERAETVIPEKSTRRTLRNHGVLIKRKASVTDEARKVLQDE